MFSMIMPEVNCAVEIHQRYTVASLTKSTFSPSRMDRVCSRKKYILPLEMTQFAITQLIEQQPPVNKYSFDNSIARLIIRNSIFSRNYSHILLHLNVGFWWTSTQKMKSISTTISSKNLNKSFAFAFYF